MKRSTKDVESRDLRSDRPVFKGRGIDKDTCVFQDMAGDRKWSDVSLGHRYGQSHLDHSALIDTFPELPNDTLPYLAGIVVVLTPDILLARLSALPIATTSDIDPTVKVVQICYYAARHLAITSV